MATKKTTVRFDTREYRVNHGAEPRGFGSWAFCLADRVNAPDYLDGAFWAHRSTFGEAKKAARAHFEAAAGGAGNVFVAVLP